MFRSINNNTPKIEIIVDGESLSVPTGITLAAALLIQDRLPIRINQPGGSPRAPHCLMGACFECMVEIEGIEQRACQVVVREGMRVDRKLNGRDQ